MRLMKKVAFATTMLLTTTSSIFAEGLDELNPEVVKRVYNPDFMDTLQPVGPSAWREWAAENPPPWTIGYASSYAGNTWRAGVMDELQNEIIPFWKELGLIDEVVITQSNLNDSTQIQQMRQLVDQGVDAIFLCCSNPTALNQTVEYAADKGVPVFSQTGYLTSEFAVNSSVNYQLAGYELGRWMGEEIGGEGNVLIVEGIPGTSGSDSQDRGIRDGLESFDGVKIVGSVAGMWTDQIAQGEVQRWLATHPGKLDGIVVQSAAEMGVLRALQQSGRADVPITIGGELGALCHWRNNPDYISAVYHVWPPQNDVQLIWNIMMRTLQGQGPKIQSVLVEPIRMTYDQIVELVPEDCDPNNPGWLRVANEMWGLDPAYIDDFFLRPADPTKFLQ